MTKRFAIPVSLAAGLSLTLMMSAAQAQGSGSSGGGASSGAGAAGSAAARSSQGTAPRGTSGQTSPNPALNNNAATQGQMTSPTANTGTGQSPTSPGGTASGSTTQGGAGGTGANAQDSSSSGQANNPTSDRSLPTQQQPLTGGGSARREGASGHDMQSCMATWDKGTHITKARWREICARTLKDQEEVRRQAESYSPRRR